MKIAPPKPRQRILIASHPWDGHFNLLTGVKGLARIDRDARVKERVREVQAELARHRPFDIIERRLAADSVALSAQ